MNINYKLRKSICFLYLIGLLANNVALSNDNFSLENKKEESLLNTKQQSDNLSKKEKISKSSIIKETINFLAIFTLGYSLSQSNTTNNYQIKMHIEGNNNNNNQINLQKNIE